MKAKASRSHSLAFKAYLSALPVGSKVDVSTSVLVGQEDQNEWNNLCWAEQPVAV